MQSPKAAQKAVSGPSPLSRMIKLLLAASWAIVALGQPAWVSWASPIAAACGYALFWKSIRGISTNRKKFWIGLAWFALVQAVQLSWMTAIEFQGLYILGVYAALIVWLGIQFGLLTLTVDRWPHLSVAALWTLFEWGRLHLLCGFSWNPVGLSLTAIEASTQMAALFGVLGLSFWVVLTNLAALHRKWKAFAVLALVPYFFGWAHIKVHEEGLEKSPTLSVGLVQTALLPSEKAPMLSRAKDFISPYEQWRRIFELVKERQTSFDLVVLPEYAVPMPAEAPAYSAKIAAEILKTFSGRPGSIKPASVEEKVSNLFFTKALASAFATEVVIGLDSSEGDLQYAAAYHARPEASFCRRYEKQVLVPLAEYVPFSWLKRFTAAYGISHFFTHGTEAKVFAGKVPFSVSICYEETFGHRIREGRLKGADLFVNVTNDNWYPFSKLPQQHFDHARLRAVENGVPLVRACNTGVTAAVDSLGRTIGKISDERKRAVLAVNVPTYQYRTLYTLWGDWGVVVLSICFLFIGAPALRSLKS